MEPAGTWPDGSPRWRCRIRLADGSKSQRIDVPHGKNESQARAHVATLQADEDAHGLLLKRKQGLARDEAALHGKPHDLETTDAWFARYLPTKNCGDAHRRIIGAVWRKWISPVIGPKPIRDLTRDDIENVRDRLDNAIDTKTLLPKTALNTWGHLTGAMNAAYADRDRTLRVHEKPLHFGVLPPKRGPSRKRPWLYPREWQAFAACPEIPGPWRQACAIALYTGLRPGELRALTWGDVCLTTKTIDVSKALDEKGTVKAPKTAHGHRTIPIHDELLPLLVATKGTPEARVFQAVDANESKLASQFREWLIKAGVTRPRLTADTPTEEPIDFRSLRDSHATWLALAGTNAQIIQRRLGHASPTTTDRYVKVAETFDVAGVGNPFPPLPEVLWTNVWPKTPLIHRENTAPAVGLEPSISESAVGFHGDSEVPQNDTEPLPRQKPRESKTIGPDFGPTEYELVEALNQAVATKNWTAVTTIASQLGAEDDSYAELSVAGSNLAGWLH